MNKWLLGLLLLLSFAVNAQNLSKSKREQYFEIGTGLYTAGDYIWSYNTGSLKVRPSYSGFMFRNKGTIAKALPLILTYKRETNTKRWNWYTHLIIEFIRERKNTDSSYKTEFQGLYSNVWGFECQYLKQRNFTMSLKFGAGVMVYQYIESYGGKFNYGNTMPFITAGNRLFPFPTFEFQPLCFRFGETDAVYVNLNLGFTGLVQMGYSKKW